MKFYDRILLELKGEPHTMRTVYSHAFSFADAVAFEYSRNLVIRRITYREARVEILRLYGFLSQTVKPGAVAALIMNNSPLWVECFWAVLMAGCTVMLLSADMTDRTLTKCLADAGCSLILGDRRSEGCETVTVRELETCAPVSVPEREPEDGWGDEVILSTSGTTGEPALFAYTGKEICSQILDSRYVLDRCADIRRFRKGQLRQLAFLPFSHIFGLTACYLWFAVFGRTFVFPEDFSPSALLRTCRLHQVTHIFAVPLLWDSLARGIRAEAAKAGRSEALEKGVRLSLALQDFCPPLGRLLVPRIMKGVREKTLGNSIRFCISGGGKCGKDTGRTVNGCGYHLENGYGMTEIGIACVTLEKKASRRTCETVGKLFPSLESKLDAQGRLLVRGDSCYAARYAGGKRIPRDPDAWFDTGDCFTRDETGELAVTGRSNDLVSGANGERIDPEAVESELDLAYPCCVVNCAGDLLTLLVQVPPECALSSRKRLAVTEEVTGAVGRLPSPVRPRRVLYTFEAIPVSLSRKYRRKYIAGLLDSGAFAASGGERFVSPEGTEGEEAEIPALAGEIALVMQEILGLSRPVGTAEDFFADLNGDSLSYIEYLNALEDRYRVAIPKESSARCATPASAAGVLSALAGM